MPERTYKNMGYRNATGFLIPCCDEAGVKVLVSILTFTAGCEV